MTGKILIGCLAILAFACTHGKQPQHISKTVTAQVWSPPGITESNDGEHVLSQQNGNTAKVLTTGIFQEGEIWQGAEESNWFGIFMDKHGFLVQSVKITAKRVTDPVAAQDEEELVKGWEIATEKKLLPLLLISGIDLYNHRVFPSALDIALYPGDSLPFQYEGKQYAIFATGDKINPDSANERYEVSNYKLYIATETNGNIRTQLLVEHQEFNEAMTTIMWAGDIDDDGMPDLIIDMSNNHNTVKPALFLSKPAGKDNIVQFVGEHSFKSF